MNITFLIGNGFDINLGLKTRYTDFYPYYLKKKHDDIISKAISDNYDRWVDLELALGQLLRNIAPDQVTEFLDSKALLEQDLAEYLCVEQQRIDLTRLLILLLSLGSVLLDDRFQTLLDKSGTLCYGIT